MATQKPANDATTPRRRAPSTTVTAKTQDTASAARKTAPRVTVEEPPEVQPTEKVRHRAQAAAAASAPAANTQALVTAVVPRGFTLTDEEHKEFRYEAGTQEMRLDHANHWYSRACGVSIYRPKAD